MEKKRNLSVIWAVLAAALYAISSPISKLLLSYISPTMMAAFLYLGAGFGMLLLWFIRKQVSGITKEQHLTKKEIPYTIAMIVLDIAAPILLMIGLSATTSANASLLNNFEIVVTSIAAMIVFKETIGKRLWLAIALITLSSMILSFEDSSSFHFSLGSIFVMLACICWGFENNCTRMISHSDPLEIVIIKGLGSGFGSLLIALFVGEQLPKPGYIFLILLLGFVAYGLSIFFYVHAQRELGAAKTSAYYAIAPFIGVALSVIIVREMPSIFFFVALLIMVAGTYFASTEKKKGL